MVRYLEKLNISNLEMNLIPLRRFWSGISKKNTYFDKILSCSPTQVKNEQQRVAMTIPHRLVTLPIQSVLILLRQQPIHTHKATNFFRTYPSNSRNFPYPKPLSTNDSSSTNKVTVSTESTVKLTSK